MGRWVKLTRLARGLPEIWSKHSIYTYIYICMCVCVFLSVPWFISLGVCLFVLIYRCSTQA